MLFIKGLWRIDNQGRVVQTPREAATVARESLSKALPSLRQDLPTSLYTVARTSDDMPVPSFGWQFASGNEQGVDRWHAEIVVI